MLNLHIQNTDKFVMPYINFINENFENDEHRFAILVNSIEDKFDKFFSNMSYIRNYKHFLKLTIFMNKADKIHLHALFSFKIIILLFSQPWLLKKCNWIIWGGDLYSYQKKKTTIKSKIYELMRKFVIRNLGALTTHVKGDYELAKKWYGAKGEYFYCFMYPSNLYKEITLPSRNNDTQKKVIQVGNSADPSNNHLEVFEKLRAFGDQDIEVICPLSYGQPDYRDKVVQQGYEMFGDNFTPLINFLPIGEYHQILAKVDIAIFNHKRQQALGNIITLLGLGKKVYIRDDITTWDFLINNEINIYNLNKELDDNLFEVLNTQDRNCNTENIKNKFSLKNLIKEWNEIFLS